MTSPARFDLADPQWLAHRHVETSGAIRFVRVERAEHAGFPFLTDEYLGTARPGCDLAARACLAALAPGRIGLLFHSAFCGSTLLARALDRPGFAMGLSEPVLLNDVVGLRRRGAPPPAVAELADTALRLLARPFGADETVVVKPSNVVNPLAELLLTLQPQARAVFLYAPLETFLISVARKGLACRLWVRELLEGYLREGYVTLGFAPEDYFRQSDLQIAALGWLAQHAGFARLARKLGARRLRTLDADRMTADPAGALAAVSAHYGLALDPALAREIAAGPVFARHSKSGAAFTPARRGAEYAAARAAHADEIDLVLRWAGQVADAAGLSLEAPFPLLDQAP